MIDPKISIDDNIPKIMKGINTASDKEVVDTLFYVEGFLFDNDRLFCSYSDILSQLYTSAVEHNVKKNWDELSVDFDKYFPKPKFKEVYSIDWGSFFFNSWQRRLIRVAITALVLMLSIKAGVLIDTTLTRGISLFLFFFLLANFCFYLFMLFSYKRDSNCREIVHDRIIRRFNGNVRPKSLLPYIRVKDDMLLLKNCSTIISNWRTVYRFAILGFCPWLSSFFSHRLQRNFSRIRSYKQLYYYAQMAYLVDSFLEKGRRG